MHMRAFILIVIYHIYDNNCAQQIVRMWTGKDEDGIGKSARATLDDVLVTETFERCLDLVMQAISYGGS